MSRTEKRPAFQVYPADVMADAAGMTPDEFKAHWCLVMAAWREEGLPVDLARRALFAGVTPDRLEAMWPVIGCTWELVDGRYVLPWMEEQRARQVHQAEVNRENGRLGGRPRRGAKPPTEPPRTERSAPVEVAHETHSVSPQKPNGIAKPNRNETPAVCSLQVAVELPTTAASARDVTELTDDERPPLALVRDPLADVERLGDAYAAVVDAIPPTRDRDVVRELLVQLPHFDARRAALGTLRGALQGIGRYVLTGDEVRAVLEDYLGNSEHTWNAGRFRGYLDKAGMRQRDAAQRDRREQETQRRASPGDATRDAALRAARTLAGSGR